MKILQITFWLSSGGAERFVVDLSNELSKTNDVTLLTLKDDSVGTEDRTFYKFDLSPRVKYMNLGLKEGFYVSYPWKVYKAIKKINPDIVHIHIGGILEYCYLACLLLGRKMTFVQTIHSDLYYGYTTKFYHFAYRTLLCRRLLRWAALSDTNYKQVKKVYPKALSRCIYNGRAPMEPTNKYEEVGKEIRSLKKDSDTKIILHVARCAPPKNQKLLIESFNELRKKGRNVILLVIGLLFDTDEGKKLQAMAGEGIYFLGTRTNISDFMLQSDIFALSSKWEGMPITLLEAMLSGMPMISTPVTGSIDVINGKNGVLSKDFSVKSYLSALEEILDNYDYYKANAMEGKESSPFTIKHCAEQYLSFYKQIVK